MYPLEIFLDFKREGKIKLRYFVVIHANSFIYKFEKDREIADFYFTLRIVHYDDPRTTLTSHFYNLTT